jgi:hypothetical protein
VGARPYISLVTAVMALSLVGLVAGVWPAKRAAAVFPSEALRADELIIARTDSRDQFRPSGV